MFVLNWQSYLVNGDHHYPTNISEKLNNGLNRIANKLIIKKKIQNRKEDQRFDDLELKNLRNMIRQQSKIAHSTGDLEEQRYLKNLKNRYSRKEKQKKKAFYNRIMAKMKKWREVKPEEGEKIPVRIKDNGKILEAPREIAHKYLDFMKCVTIGSE